MTVFIWGGILKLSDSDSDNFHWGGILKLSDSDSLTIFIRGGILKLSDLDSDNFHFGGYSELQNRGYSEADMICINTAQQTEQVVSLGVTD